MTGSKIAVIKLERPQILLRRSRKAPRALPCPVPAPSGRHGLTLWAVAPAPLAIRCHD
jgi:hypothetical protein